MSPGVGTRVVLGDRTQLPGRRGVVVSVHPTGMVSVRLDGPTGGVLAVAGSRVEVEDLRERSSSVAGLDTLRAGARLAGHRVIEAQDDERGDAESGTSVP